MMMHVLFRTEAVVGGGGGGGGLYIADEGNFRRVTTKIKVSYD